VLNKYLHKYQKKEKNLTPSEDNLINKDKKEKNEQALNYKQEKNQKYLKAIATLGLEKQNEFLTQQGFTNTKRNLCALIENDGDAEKALPSLKKSERFKEEFKQAYIKEKLSPEEKQKHNLEKLAKLNYTAQNQVLVDAGFTDTKKNLKYLKKFDGNAEKVILVIMEKDEKHKARKEAKLKDPSKTKEPKDKKEKPVENPKKTYESVPENIQTIYLDGNNMLFVDDNIRKMMLSRKKKDAEKVLASLAMKFSSIAQRVEIILVFDNTNQVSEEKIICNDGKSFKFVVCSASPKYQSSDDALVDWAGLNPNVKNALFVTSDKGLRLRLREKGAEEVMSTGNWFRVLKSVIGSDIYDSIVQTPKI